MAGLSNKAQLAALGLISLAFAFSNAAEAYSNDDLVYMVRAEEKVFGHADNRLSLDQRLDALEASVLGRRGAGSSSQRLHRVLVGLQMAAQEANAAPAKSTKKSTKVYGKKRKHQNSGKHVRVAANMPRNSNWANAESSAPAAPSQPDSTPAAPAEESTTVNSVADNSSSSGPPPALIVIVAAVAAVIMGCLGVVICIFLRVKDETKSTAHQWDASSWDYEYEYEEEELEQYEEQEPSYLNYSYEASDSVETTDLDEALIEHCFGASANYNQAPSRAKLINSSEQNMAVDHEDLPLYFGEDLGQPQLIADSPLQDSNIFDAVKSIVERFATSSEAASTEASDDFMLLQQMNSTAQEANELLTGEETLTNGLASWMHRVLEEAHSVSDEVQIAIAERSTELPVQEKHELTVQSETEPDSYAIPAEFAPKSIFDLQEEEHPEIYDTYTNLSMNEFFWSDMPASRQEPLMKAPSTRAKLVSTEDFLALASAAQDNGSENTPAPAEATQAAALITSAENVEKTIEEAGTQSEVISTEISCSEVPANTSEVKAVIPSELNLLSKYSLPSPIDSLFKFIDFGSDETDGITDTTEIPNEFEVPAEMSNDLSFEINDFTKDFLKDLVQSEPHAILTVSELKSRLASACQLEAETNDSDEFNLEAHNLEDCTVAIDWQAAREYAEATADLNHEDSAGWTSSEYAALAQQLIHCIYEVCASASANDPTSPRRSGARTIQRLTTLNKIRKPAPTGEHKIVSAEFQTELRNLFSQKETA